MTTYKLQTSATTDHYHFPRLKTPYKNMTDKKGATIIKGSFFLGSQNFCEVFKFREGGALMRYVSALKGCAL